MSNGEEVEEEVDVSVEVPKKKKKLKKRVLKRERVDSKASLDDVSSPYADRSRSKKNTKKGAKQSQKTSIFVKNESQKLVDGEVRKSTKILREKSVKSIKELTPAEKLVIS